MERLPPLTLRGMDSRPCTWRGGQDALPESPRAHTPGWNLLQPLLEWVGGKGGKRDNPTGEQRETGTEGEGAAGQGRRGLQCRGWPGLPREPAGPLLPSSRVWGYAGESRAPEWKGDRDP